MNVHGILASGSLEPELQGAQTRAAPLQSLVKRTVDVLGALLLLVMLLPAFIALAVLVWTTSPGPILFCQERVGRGGRLFYFYKFRTMVHGSDAAPHRDFYRHLVSGDLGSMRAMYKLTNDPRVTPLGRVLRRLSMDELPQLINVLKGDMSLVGPRPPIPYEVEMYGEREMMRLSVLPGLTGLWQVSGRGAVAFERMIELDLEYIGNWSLGLDLLILLRTPWAVLTGKGAS
jgi:lipopolysaccharide/colanic/teichoic acid biosynthesis glycosyltransferase